MAVGGPFLTNPDLVRWLEIVAQLIADDESSFYGGSGAGYIDYPTVEQVA